MDGSVNVIFEKMKTIFCSMIVVDVGGLELRAAHFGHEDLSWASPKFSRSRNDSFDRF